MATTYTSASAQLDEIAAKVLAAEKERAQARALLVKAYNTLNGIPSAYSGLIQDVDDNASNNPLNEAYQNQKARKDQMAADFQALKSTVKSDTDALGITPA